MSSDNETFSPLKENNFVFVDLCLRDSNYQTTSETANDDVAAICTALMDSTIALHKTEVFSQFDDKGFQDTFKATSNPVATLSQMFWRTEKQPAKEEPLK